MGAYSKIVWQHFNQPKNVGLIEAPDVFGRVGSPYGGPFMVFSAKIEDKTITEIKFQTYGCAPAIAAGSFLTEFVSGKTVQEAAEWTVEKLVGELGGLPQDKVHCAVLAIGALQVLLQNAAKKIN
jgi:nitrogen fixation protein NifU and related proteins